METQTDITAPMQTAARRRRIARGAGRKEVDVTNMIGSFSGMRAKMQSLSKMMKMGGGARLPLSASLVALTNVRLCSSRGAGLAHACTLCAFCCLARTLFCLHV